MRFSEAFSLGTALGRGWSAIRRAPVPLLVGCVLLVVSGSHCGFEAEDLADLPRWAWDFLGVAILGGGLWGVLLFALQAFVMPGYLRAAESALHGRTAPFEVLFQSGDRFLDMLLWQLLRGALLVATALGLALPLVPLGILGSVAAIFGREHWEPVGGVGVGIALGLVAVLYVVFFALPVFFYVELGLFFGRYLVALEGNGPGAALRLGWGLVDGRRIHLFLYRAVMFAVAAAGVFALGIGYFVTRATTDAGTTGAFLALRRGAWPTGVPAPPAPPPSAPGSAGAAGPPALESVEPGPSPGDGA